VQPAGRATEISRRCHSSPISHSAGAMICSSISALLRLATSASRIATSAATSSPESSASAYARPILLIAESSIAL
jgi:hypothetical protein